MKQKYSALIVGGDSVEVTITFEKEKLHHMEWQIVGRPELYLAVEKIIPQMRVAKDQLPVPTGTTPEQLLLRELLLKIRGEWGDAPSDPELCHCRKIPQTHVERAIILGAHTIEKVRARSAANTSCGTCLPEVEELFKKYGVQ